MKQNYFYYLTRIIMSFVLLVTGLQGAFAQFKVVGYAASWSAVASEIQYSKLTHINYSFIRPTTTGGLTAIDQPGKLQDIVSRGHSAGTKVGIAVGGWSDLNNGDFQSMAGNASYRSAFVNNLINLCNQYNLDGVDIDWEYPKDGNDPSNYATMMNELGNALHAKGKYLSAAVAGDSYYGSGIQNSVFNIVDMLNLMVYDNTGSSEGHSSYNYAVSCLNYWLGRGLPASKCMLGVPFYGKPDVAYKTLLTQGASPNSDWFGNVSYNGIPTIKNKTNLAFDRAIGGIMIWEISQDATGANSLLNAINDVKVARGGGGGGTQGPFGGTARNIPGQIEAEDYDTGGEGLAYHDSDGSNSGGAYRSDGVDIEACTDAGGGNNVGYIVAGEWLEYTVNVTAGTYKLDARVASTTAGNTFHIELDGANISGTITVPNTGGWQTWQTVSVNTSALAAGQKKILKIVMDGGNFNLNNVNFTAVATNKAPTVNITAPANNASYTAPANINITADASDPDGSVSKVEFYNGTTLLGTDNSSPYSFAWNNVAAGTYSLTAKATDDKGAVTTSSAVSVKVNVAQGPYNGTAATIPGKIEAENYDVGGEGVAYHDGDATNSGNAYRTDGVDIEATTDAGGGYNVGYIAAGEWMEYTVNVTAGTYKLDARVAATAAGNTFHVELDGQNISGTITAPNTGGWQTWQTVSVTTTTLTAGTKVLKIAIDGGSFNLNNITFSSNTVSNKAPSVSIIAPANSASFTAPASITITANASDSDGSVSKVEFYNGSTLLGSSTASPYSYTWTNVAVGTYSITAKATDDKGAATTSSAVSVSVNSSSNCNQVIWSDEFNNTSLDQSKWSYQTGDGCPSLCGWGNNELEYYTNSTNNVSVSGGSLSLTARYEPNYNGTGRNYTSGKLVSSGKYSHTYGKFEARIKIPSAQGVWPAFWLLPDGGGWPQNGEIDILETVNKNSNYNGTLHYANSSGGHLSSGTSWTPPSDLGNDYHIYAADWTKDQITFYVDGVVRGTVTKAALQANGGVWPFDSHNFYIILNVAVGGNWPGNPVSSEYPVSMLVDYVRVYDNSPCTVTESPYGGTARSIPGKIEAEDYDLGGEGVSYHDASTTNEGGAYRNDAVDIEVSTDAGGGNNVGYITAGEYLKYMVNVTAGNYKLEARVASTTAGNTFHVELDGQNISGTITVPNTGGWQTWQTVTVNTSALAAGQNKILKVVMDGGNFNFNYLNFTSTTTSTNQNPIVSITSPSSNASFTAPASISISANASDSDGSVSKVEFYNGTVLLNTSTASPYSFTWDNVAAGTYTITAKATDDKGATASSSVSVTVKTNGDGGGGGTCSGVAQYAENGGYAAGSKVQNQGSQYECKPYPYSGWCNGAAWAYAPGTGTYWQDAWNLVGTCASTPAAETAPAASAMSNAPNPFVDQTTITVSVKMAGQTSVKLYDRYGNQVAVIADQYLTEGTYQFTIDGHNLAADIYVVKMVNGSNVETTTIVKGQ